MLSTDPAHSLAESLEAELTAEPTQSATGSGVQSLRELIPPELQRRVTVALRELPPALRALIEWYLERVERRRTAPAEVQDIPIL